MNLRDIKSLLKLIEGTDVSEIEWEGESGRVAIRRGPPAPTGPTFSVSAPPSAPFALQPGTAPTAAAAPLSGHVLKSPLVGTFYSAPTPDALPFTDVGKRVQKGQVLCIIEAMKLMNEITAEVSGTVRQVLVENGHPVEFGQTLFVIDPA